MLNKRQLVIRLQLFSNAGEFYGFIFIIIYMFPNSFLPSFNNMHESLTFFKAQPCVLQMHETDNMKLNK